MVNSMTKDKIQAMIRVDICFFTLSIFSPFFILPSSILHFSSFLSGIPPRIFYHPKKLT